MSYQYKLSKITSFSFKYYFKMQMFEKKNPSLLVLPFDQKENFEIYFQVSKNALLYKN